MGVLTYRRLSAENPVDVQQLQEVFDSTASYFETIQGHGPASDEARSDLVAVPEGRSADNLYYFLIEASSAPVGCASIFRGHPRGDVAYVGLLLFTEPNQSKGYGPETLCFVDDLAREWGCSLLRVAVVQANTRAHKFWLGQGFAEIERKSSEQYGPSIIMDRAVIAE